MQSAPAVFETNDGIELRAIRYVPDGDAIAAVLIAPAMGVPQDFYARFATFCASRGCQAVTFDYRGIQRRKDRPIPLVPQSILDWGVHDLSAAIAFTRRVIGDRPVFLVTHSVGGQLFGFTHQYPEVSAAVCYASAHGYFKNWPEDQHTVLRHYWTKTLPDAVKAEGYFPGSRLGTSDLPSSAALEWARWCLSPHYFCDERGNAIRGFHGDIRVPMAFIAASDDAMAPPSTVEAMRRLYCHAKTTMTALSPGSFDTQEIGHFNYLKDPVFESDWGKRLDWLFTHATNKQGTAA